LGVAPQRFAFGSKRSRSSKYEAERWHTLVRCPLLYFDALPERWRGSDWGYWSASERSSGNAEA
jgi:hypothetical protein